MGRLRMVLTLLLGVVLSGPGGTSGSEFYRTVRPGDDITLYCDCRRSTGVYIVWYRNCSHENQPTLVLRLRPKFSESLPPRFNFVLNKSTQSYDLLIQNITDSDLGLYYCGTEQNNVVDEEKITRITIYKYGNVTTRILFNSSTSEPPGLQPCGLCWVLVFTLCPASAVVSCLLSSVCWQFCQRTAKEPPVHQRRPDTGRERRDQEEDGVCYAALDIRQTSRRPKMKKDRSSDFSTYSALNTSRM